MIYYARLSHIRGRTKVQIKVIKENTLDEGVESKVEKDRNYIGIHAKSRAVLARLIKEYTPQIAGYVKFVHIRQSGPAGKPSATRLLSEGQKALKALVATLKATGKLG